MKTSKTAGIPFLILSLIAALALTAASASAESSESSVSDAAAVFSAEEMPADSAIFQTPENGIPLLIIEIDESSDAIRTAREDDPKHEYGTIREMNDSEKHTVRCIGNVRFIVPDEYEGEYGSSAAPENVIPLKYIRGRGNSTWQEEKKPYKIEFQDPQELFGMESCAEWALLANSMDRTLVKNRITYWLGEQTGLACTPRQVPVDVVMTGSESGSRYLGSYCLCETVEETFSRIDVPKLKKSVTDKDPAASPNITGSYLLSLYSEGQDGDKPKSTVFKSEPTGIMFINKTPEFDGEDDELTEGQLLQREYIRSFINEVDALIMSPDQIGEAEHNAIAEKMDLTSTADYWWLQEFSINTDAYITSSTYLYKTRDTASEKGRLYWGPLWDFDLAWDMTGSETDQGAATGFYYSEMPWLDALRANDPLFAELLKERWLDPENGINIRLKEMTRPGGLLDRYLDEVKASAHVDRNTWKTTDEEPDTGLQFEETIEILRKWIEARRAWVNEHLDEVAKVYFTVTYEADGEVIDTETVRGFHLPKKRPEAPDREGYLFIDWKDKETGESYSTTVVKEDITVTAEYVEESEIVPVKGLYFSRYEDWAGLDKDTYYMNRLTAFPENATPGWITWTSSDESTAEASAGTPVLVGTGDVTITASLKNGVTASYLLHVYDPKETTPVTPESLTAVPPALTIKEGQPEQLRYSLAPEGCMLRSYSLSFTSSDPDVAAPDDNDTGIITGLKPGKAVVTVTVSSEWGDESGPAFECTADCEVTVEAAE